MKIVASHTPVSRAAEFARSGGFLDRRIVYELLACPVCEAVTLRSYYAGGLEKPTDNGLTILYPQRIKGQVRLSTGSSLARASEKAKARAIMIRRLSVIRECNQKSRKARFVKSRPN